MCVYVCECTYVSVYMCTCTFARLWTSTGNLWEGVSSCRPPAAAVLRIPGQVQDSLSPAPVSCPSPHLPGLQIIDVTLSEGSSVGHQAVELQLAAISSAACLLSTRAVRCLVKYIICWCAFPLCRLPLLFLDNVKIFGLI